jgi:two-component system chemotaxis response regulator CheB
MDKNGNTPIIIVIGASAGGLNAINEIVAQIPENINAAVFIVLHLSKVGLGDFLIHRIQKYTQYSCSSVINGEPIKPKHIYVAVPDQHLLVKDGKILLGAGPAENRWRPSIDVLFRSAAASYGNRVIGIVLTGLLNDGTSGMNAIKRSGGYCIVQDPNEAEYPDMPLSVLEHMEVDYCVRLSKMGETINEIVLNAPVKEDVVVPKDVIAEANIAEKVAIGLDKVMPLGDHALYACPDCGGGLWNIKSDNIERYRCHVGHSYTENDLLIKQSQNLEATMWVALRMMEERRNLLNKIGNEEDAKGLSRLAFQHKKQADELAEHIDKLKNLLISIQRD